jgi:putative ABC transport system ATP-binding protein
MLLSLKSITRTYQMGEESIFALNNVSWSMEPGDYVSVTGPSGSGKSTMMHIIGCLDTPDSGQYLFEGRELSSCSSDERAAFRNCSIGFVFQQFKLISYLTAAENVMLPLRYAGMGRSESHERALSSLSRVGLQQRAGSLPGEMSGGQQQRVAIARAIANKPRLILADEPTGALDSKNTQEILSLFDELSEHGVGLIVVTHDMQVAARAKNTIRLADGKLVSNGWAAEKLRRS